MSGHVVELAMMGCGPGVGLKVVCQEPPEAKCRWVPITPDCQCEEYGIMEIDEQGPYHVTEGPPPALDRKRLEDWLESKHRMAYGGACNIVQWLSADDEPWESYAGGVVPLGSRPIVTMWNGDHYEWELA